MNRLRTFVGAASLFAAAATLGSVPEPQGGADPQVRRAATIDALRQFPGYFHLAYVVLHGELAESGRQVSLRADEREIPLLLNDTRTTTGLVEVRGQLLDVGRLEPGDPRVAGYDGARDPERWPRPGEDLVISVTGIIEAQRRTAPSVRALALQPWRFDGQEVTVTGQFRGRNLFGDVPSAPGTSKYDFVLRSADAAVWVTGLRPRGRDFELNVDARVDTGKWFEVTGVVSRERGLVTIAGRIIKSAEPPDDPGPEDDTITPVAPLDPGEVVFSSPIEGEGDVAPTSPVRIQFSRGLNPATLEGRIQARYVGATAPADAAPLTFEHTYDAATRAIEITFSEPLERFRTVTVELHEGIRTFDGGNVTPWSVTFSIGG